MVLYFLLEALNAFKNQVLSTFGNSAQCTKRTYRMSLGGLKKKKVATVIVGHFSLEKRLLKSVAAL